MTEEQQIKDQTQRYGRVFALTALLLAAVNLRLAVTSVGPVLAEIRAGLGMSAAVAGLLTSLPVVCFAAFGFSAPRLARRFGTGTVVAAGLIVLAGGLAIRPFAPNTVVFVLISGLSLAGIALVNVLMPVIVKERFPGQTGTMTGLYSVSLNVGATTAAAATVPLTNLLGGDWRFGLASWAVVAALAVPPWLFLARDRIVPSVVAPSVVAPSVVAPSVAASSAAASSSAVPSSAGPARNIARSPVAWALAVYFGMQSTSAYVMIGWLPQIFRDAGLSAEKAGVLFAVTSFLGIPLSFVLTALAARYRSQSAVAATCAVFGLAGWSGLWLAPAAAPWVWAILLGIANCAFPLALVMITLRGRSPATVVRLSAFAQGVGYILAIPTPILVGVLRDASGGWRLPLGLVVALVIPQLIAGVLAGRDRQV